MAGYKDFLIACESEFYAKLISDEMKNNKQKHVIDFTTWNKGVICYAESKLLKSNNNKLKKTDFIAWKAHISINPIDLEKAWPLIFPLLEAHATMFTVWNPKDITCLKEGMQFTIYMRPGHEKLLQSLLTQLEQVLKMKGIKPGIITGTDRPLGEFVSVRHSGENNDSLVDPFLSCQSDADRVAIRYEHAVFDNRNGRMHSKLATMAKQTGIKGKYDDLSGDHLKTMILIDLKNEIINIKSKKEFIEFKSTLMNRPEYQVLKQGQDRFTRMFGLKTSSIVALSKIIEENDIRLQKPKTVTFSPES